MKLNENIDVAKARWQAWFDGTLTAGPIVGVTAPLPEPREKPLPLAEPATAEARRTDADYLVRSTRNEMMATFFGGDAIPSRFVNLGAGAVAAFLGGRYSVDERTVWFGGFAEDDGLEFLLDRMAYDPDNAYWRSALGVTRALLAASDGMYWTSYADLGGELDILASLRGTQKLLTDLLERPELVHRCEEKICDLWLRYFRELTEIFDASDQDGYTCWLACWSARPWYTLQCDISVTFSPEMFAEFVVPRLRRKCQAMGNAVYHWDGPGELAHLDHILSVPGINALEYVSVPADPPNWDLHWLPYYRRIAEAGRGVYIRVTDPDGILELSRKMPAERLAFRIHMPSVREAKRFLARFGDLSRV